MKIILFTASILCIISCTCLQAQQKNDNQKELFTTIRHNQSEYSVTKFTLDKPWVIPQNVRSLDEFKEQWKILVLIGKSDASRLLTNAKFRDLHESTKDFSDDLIEQQKERMRQLFSNPSDPLRVENLYLVMNKQTSRACLVIPVVSERGVSYSSYARFNGNWKIVVADAPDPILRSFPDVLLTYNELNGEDSIGTSDKELDEITRIHIDRLPQPE